MKKGKKKKKKKKNKKRIKNENFFIYNIIIKL